MSNSETIAVLDFGTNTLKMTVAEIAESQIREVFSDAESLRIGKEIDPETGCIAAGAIERALVTLGEYEQSAREHGATRFVGVATEAFRTAANGLDLLQQIQTGTSWRLRIIPGDEEARLTFIGLQRYLPASGTGVIVDIGGGSTEVIVALNRDWVGAESLRVGSGGLTDRFLAHDPPTIEELALARHDADFVIGKLGIARPATVDVLLLAGGAGQFLNELALATWQVPLSLALLPEVERILASLTSHAITERITISQQRARVLPGGLQIGLGTIAWFRPVELVAVPSGIRMGILQEILSGNWPEFE